MYTNAGISVPKKRKPRDQSKRTASTHPTRYITVHTRDCATYLSANDNGGRASGRRSNNDRLIALALWGQGSEIAKAAEALMLAAEAGFVPAEFVPSFINALPDDVNVPTAGQIDFNRLSRLRPEFSAQVDAMGLLENNIGPRQRDLAKATGAPALSLALATALASSAQFCNALARSLLVFEEFTNNGLRINDLDEMRPLAAALKSARRMNDSQHLDQEQTNAATDLVRFFGGFADVIRKIDQDRRRSGRRRYSTLEQVCNDKDSVPNDDVLLLATDQLVDMWLRSPSLRSQAAEAVAEQTTLPDFLQTCRSASQVGRMSYILTDLGLTSDVDGPLTGDQKSHSRQEL
jgi:hypothetical protein